MAIITTKQLPISYCMLRPISGKREDPGGKGADRRSALTMSGNPGGQRTERIFLL
jgi:hypothetical protein